MSSIEGFVVPVPAGKREAHVAAELGNDMPFDGRRTVCGGLQPVFEEKAGA